MNCTRLKALLLWKLNRYSCQILFGINCTALGQSELSNFVECTIMFLIQPVWQGVVVLADPHTACSSIKAQSSYNSSGYRHGKWFLLIDAADCEFDSKVGSCVQRAILILFYWSGRKYELNICQQPLIMFCGMILKYCFRAVTNFRSRWGYPKNSWGFELL